MEKYRYFEEDVLGFREFLSLVFWFLFKEPYLWALNHVLANISIVVFVLSELICWRCWKKVFGCFKFHLELVNKKLAFGRQYAEEHNWHW